MTASSFTTAQTVSAIAVIDLANELVEKGYINKADFADFGRDFINLFDAWKNSEAIQEYRLPEALLIMLWRLAEAHCNESDIGLEIGSKVNLKSKGVLANWLTQCNTLSEAFSIFRTNISLLNPSECWEKTEDGDRVKLVVRFTSPKYPSIAIDRSMTAMLSWGRSLSKEEIELCGVTFVRQVPKRLEKYHSFFGESISFNQTENALWFSKRDFNQTIKEANAYLKKLIAMQAMSIDTELAKANTRSYVDTIINLLDEDLAQYCQVGKTCSAIHVSRSTLYRKLKNEGTSFTLLVKAARLTKLKKTELIQVNHNDMADELGFQDISSYYRFRKQNC